MNNAHSLDALKARLPDYLQELGCDPHLRGDRKLTARCPLHADNEPSLTADLNDRTWLWFCHPCATGGSIVDLHVKLRGLTDAEAIGELSAKYFGDGLDWTPPQPPPAKAIRPPHPWPELIWGTRTHLCLLANLRCLPVDAVERARDMGYLRYAEYHGEHCYARRARAPAHAGEVSQCEGYGDA